MAINQDSSTPFFLVKKEFILVKPSKPTNYEILSLSTIDNDPNLEILCPTIYVYQGNDSISCEVSANTNGVNQELTFTQKDPAAVIQESLSKALVYYYPLAGKLKRQTDGKLQLNCNSEGVPFSVATANCRLSSLSYLDGIDVETARKLVIHHPSDNESIGYHPLVFQVTKFSCGGFTIGMIMSHSVCDGFGAAQFFRALTELASGKTEPSVKPVWERERLVAKPTQEFPQSPIDNASLATSPYVPSSDVAHACFNIPAESIKKLKTTLVKDVQLQVQDDDEILKEGFGFTTLEVLAAYVWRARARALKLSSDGKTLFGVAVGMRKILDPSLPEGYYGNAFVSANVVMKVKELNEAPLASTVKLIKESKKVSCNSEYIWKMMGQMEKLWEMKMKIEGGNGAFMLLTDWRNVGLLEEVDFGWKTTVNMIPVPWNLFGYIDLCIFMPPSKLNQSMQGGVRVLVSMPRTAMAKLREEMDGLMLVG